MDEQTARRVSADPRVRHVEQDMRVYGFSTQYSAPTHLDRIDQWTGTDGTYSYTNSGSGVNVYVFDSGVRTSHDEFSGGGAEFGVDGVTDPCAAHDPNDPVPFVTDDPLGHGTWVAGLIAGGTYGVAKNAHIISVRVIDQCNSARVSDIIDAIEYWAIPDHENRGGPAVANFSLGGEANTDLDDAVEDLIEAGITVVVAAGNFGIDTSYVSPARVSEAIVVGATDSLEARAIFGGGHASDYGSSVDLFAPGVDLPSAGRTSDSATHSDSGTSGSAPLVAGLAARYLEVNPYASPADVEAAIVDAATPDIVLDPQGSPNNFMFTGDVDGDTPAPNPPSGLSVSLQAVDNQYVSADLGGGAYVYDNRSSAGSWETFTLVDLNGGSLADGDPVAFRTDSGRYLQADNGGGYEMDAWGEYHWAYETFTLIDLDHPSGSVTNGDRIALQSNGGYYACAESGGNDVINVNRTSIGSWETFVLVIH